MEKEIYGQAYQALKRMVKKYAASDLSVLFYGETGTGKELFAQYYMKHCNERPDKKTIRTVNCAAFTEQLLHSEIFGHAKGAFTGAATNRPGILKTCAGGIVFLDELGKASLQFQAAILRVAQGDSFRQVGSDKEEKNTNVRIIGATTNLSSIIEELKHRFIIVRIPSLQKEDILEIVRGKKG
ncbi:MAG: sigma 54-interacting transcriptional regulator, partial [Syntrophales bacterium]|nr:sigma 54-interacting transcriptional regulator [Syntrophales bacterium]